MQLLQSCFCISKNLFLKNLYSSGTQCGGFQFLLILDLWGISFHAAVVFALGKNLLFKSVLGHCEMHFLDYENFICKMVIHVLT